MPLIKYRSRRFGRHRAYFFYCVINGAKRFRSVWPKSWRLFDDLLFSAKIFLFLTKFLSSTKISIFNPNRSFSKITILTTIFDQNFYFWPYSELCPDFDQFSIVDQNFDLCPKLRFWPQFLTKMCIFDQNFYFWPNSALWPLFWPIFDCGPKFWSLTKFRFLAKISCIYFQSNSKAKFQSCHYEIWAFSKLDHVGTNDTC